MAVSVADVALELRLIAAADDPVAPGHQSILGRHIATAAQLVSERTREAPEDLQDAAVLSIAAYLFDKPSAPGGRSFSQVWSNSGAEMMLSRYVVRRARVIGTTSPTPASGTGTGGPGVDQVARDAAAAARAIADGAQEQADDNKAAIGQLSSGNVDATARAAASLALDETGRNKQDIILNRSKLVDSAPAVKGIAAGADAGIVDAETGGYFTWAVASVTRLVERIVPAWARQPNPPSGGGGDAGLQGRVLGTLDEKALDEAGIAAALNALFYGRTAETRAVAGDLAITYKLANRRNASIVHIREFRLAKPGGGAWEAAERWPVTVAWSPGDKLPAYAQAETQGLLSRAGNLFWQVLNLVPNTPGDASGVGHVLAATGENDRDYAFRGLPALLKLANNGGLEFNGGELQTTPSLVAAAAQADAAAAGLDLQAVAVATVDSYGRTIAAQKNATGALILQAMAELKGNVGDLAVDFPAGQIIWFPPKSDAPEPLFVLPAGGGALPAADAAKLAGITRDDETAATNAADTALGKRIDALATVADPVFIPDEWVKNGDARTLAVRLDPAAIVAGDAKVRLHVQGTNVGTVAIVAGRHVYQFDVSAADAGTITRAAGNAGLANLSATVELLGARDVVTRTQRGILHVVAAPRPAVGGVGFTTLMNARHAAAASAGGGTGPSWSGNIPDAEKEAILNAIEAGHPLLFTLETDNAADNGTKSWSAWWGPRDANRSGINLIYGEFGLTEGAVTVGFEMFSRRDDSFRSFFVRPKPLAFVPFLLTFAGQGQASNNDKAAAHRLTIQALG